MPVLERWGPVLEVAQRNCSHPLHPNKSSPLLYNPRSYTDTEGARDYSTQITRQLLLLSPSLQGLQKATSTGNAPCGAPFSTYARKASVHTGEASLTQKRQTAINTFLLGAAHAVWHLCASFRWLWRVWVFITMNFLTAGTRRQNSTTQQHWRNWACVHLKWGKRGRRGHRTRRRRLLCRGQERRQSCNRRCYR